MFHVQGIQGSPDRRTGSVPRARPHPATAVPISVTSAQRQPGQEQAGHGAWTGATAGGQGGVGGQGEGGAAARGGTDGGGARKDVAELLPGADQSPPPPPRRAPAPGSGTVGPRSYGAAPPLPAGAGAPPPRTLPRPLEPLRQGLRVEPSL